MTSFLSQAAKSLGAIGILLSICSPAIGKSRSARQPAQDDEIKSTLDSINSSSGEGDSTLASPAGQSGLEEALSFIPSLGFGLRLDSQYSGGGMLEQGFAIPSARLTAFGELDSHLRYRLSLGQAKEFSAVALPTMVPVEAYIDLLSAPEYGLSEFYRLRWRIGMFTPSFNPWWTPDLADLVLPEYHLLHTYLFLNRDIGTELVLMPFAERLTLFGGYFNGTGIFGSNNSSARAATAGVRIGIPIGDVDLDLGGSGYYSEQSSPGTSTFRTRRLATVYLRARLRQDSAELTLETSFGRFDEALGNTAPTGTAGTLRFRVMPNLQIWGRAETMSGISLIQPTIRRFQVGPIFNYGPSLTTYLLFEHLDEGDLAQDMGIVRVRLVI